jgi:hypothetical protein
VLREKYKLDASDAQLVASFLTPMLAWNAGERVDARTSLQHAFFSADFSDRSQNPDAAH